MANDAINPKHYQGVLVIPAERVTDLVQPDGSISLQYIEVMEFMMTEEEFKGHLKGQAWKYLLRLGSKDEEVQELGKSKWYISYLQNFFGRKKK
jgi:predicted transcriptional regulator